jgi:hypothetical protein
MGVENLQTAHQQHRHAQEIDPMGQPVDARVPVNEQAARAPQRPSWVRRSNFTHGLIPVLAARFVSSAPAQEA